MIRMRSLTTPGPRFGREWPTSPPSMPGFGRRYFAKLISRANDPCPRSRRPPAPHDREDGATAAPGGRHGPLAEPHGRAVDRRAAWPDHAQRAGRARADPAADGDAG